jgi:hypothetical protein
MTFEKLNIEFGTITLSQSFILPVDFQEVKTMIFNLINKSHYISVFELNTSNLS